MTTGAFEIGYKNKGLDSVKFYNSADKPAAFSKSREQWGEFSNMCGGFPIVVNDLRFQSSEGLYQALKFPHAPDKQRDIAQANNGFWAKKVAYRKDGVLPYDQWDDHRVDAMRVSLAFKVAQHPKLIDVILASGSQDIVEKSSRDAFWGANPIGSEGFQGANVLGKLWMDLRCHVTQGEHGLVWLAALEFASSSFRNEFTINGAQLTPDMLTAEALGELKP